MPWPFRKKKKKKLPDPPSFYEQREKAMQGAPKQPPPLPTPKQQVVEESPRQQVFEGPPRQQVFEGPPRQQPDRGIAAPPNLPPPPPFAGNVPSQSPQQQHAKGPVPIFDNDLASEIHAELRQRDFGSTMKKIPEKEPVSFTTEDLAKQHFRNSKQEYIEAGNKHLELNFYDNAATNYACAILCDLISEGLEPARITMSNLSLNVPSAVAENNFFDNVRLLLEAIKVKNHAFLTRAENLLKKNMEHLYPEDIAMVEKAIKTARVYFGY